MADLLSDDDIFGTPATAPSAVRQEMQPGAATRQPAAPALLSDDDVFGAGQEPAAAAPVAQAPAAATPPVAAAVRNPTHAEERERAGSRFEGESFGDLMTRRGQEFGLGLTGMFSTGMKGIAAWQAAHQRGTNLMEARDDEIRAREAAGEPVGLGAMQDPAFDTTVRRRAGLMPTTPTRERAAYKGGVSFDAWAKETIGTPPEDESFWSDFSSGAGSFAAFMAMSIPAAALGPAGPVAATTVGGGFGAMANSGQIYDEALQHGATEDQALDAAGLGRVVGSTEVVPILGILKPLDRAFPTLKNKVLAVAGKALRNATEEGLQEGLSQILNNAIASHLYDPERGWADGVTENMAIGALLGFGTGGAVGMVSGEVAQEGGPTPTPTGSDEELYQEGERVGRMIEAAQARGAPVEEIRQLQAYMGRVTSARAAKGDTARQTRGGDAGRQQAPRVDPRAPRRDLPVTADQIVSPIPTASLQEGQAMVDAALRGDPIPDFAKDATPAEVLFGKVEEDEEDAPPALVGTGGDRGSAAGRAPEAEGSGRGLLPSQPASGEPPVKPGFVRMYHGTGGAQEAGSVSGERWFSSDRTYARDYRGGGEAGLSYVDVPRNDPMFDADYSNQTVDQGVTVNTQFDPARYGGARRTASAEAPPVFDPAEANTAAAAVAPEPTPAQAKAGNYAKGHMKVGGLDVSIETSKGGTRRGTAPDGTAWQTTMPAHYGQILGTTGADGDPVDIYVGDDAGSHQVFVIDQRDPETGAFDEHKVISGVRTAKEAIDLYNGGFSDGSGPSRIGDVQPMRMVEFKRWLRNGDTTRPVAVSAEAMGKEPPRPQKRPFINLMRRDGIRINPDSQTGRELINVGLTPSKVPGLFSRDAKGDLDNLPASEHPEIAQILGEDNGYLPYQALIDAIIEEANGRPVRGADQAEIAKQREEWESAVRGAAEAYAPETDFDPLDVPEPWIVDREQDIRSDEERWNDIKRSVDAAIRDMKITEAVTHEERRAIIDDLAAQGGSIEQAIEREMIRSVFDAEAGRPFDGEGYETPPGWEEPAAAGGDAGPGEGGSGRKPDAVSEDAGGTGAGDRGRAGPGEEARPAAGVTRTGTLEGGAVDVTPEGEQTVIPGAEKAPDRGVAEQAMKKPLRGGAAAMQDEGLFGDPANRVDLFDAAAQGEPVPLQGTAGEDAGTIGASPPASSPAITIEPLTEKSVIVRGIGRDDVARFGDMGKVTPLWNEKQGGWVFSKKHEAKLRDRLIPKPERWKRIGENAKGHPLFEDENGVRSYTERGIRITESVQVNPAGFAVSVDHAKRGGDYLTGPERAAAEKPEPAKSAADAAFDEAFGDVFGEDEASSAPEKPSAKGAAAAAVKETGQGLADIAKGFNALFGDPDKLSSGLTFDKESYEKAKPLFIAGLKHFQSAGKSTVELMTALLRGLKENGLTAEVAKRMRPYIVRFVDDVESGAVVLEASVEEAPAESAKPTPNYSDPIPGTRDRAKTETLAAAFREAFAAGRQFATIVQARAFASETLGEKLGESDYKMMEEAIEAAVVMRAREIVKEARQRTEGQAKAFDAMVALYEAQPILGTRTSTSVEQQAYSTPAPLAFLASRLAGIKAGTTVYEPTAGNGMLLMDARPSNVTANELNPDRFANLQAILGPDATLTQGDATQETGPKGVQVVIANPPFGKSKTPEGTNRRFPMWKRNTTEIDHAISFRALEAMDDDGKAVLIIGGQRGTDAERTDGYRATMPLAFMANLYANYNVVEHFTVDGDLYRRQGAGWPVDVIVIDGRGQSKKPLPGKVLPTIYSEWSQLRERLDGKDSLDTRERGAGAGGRDGQPGATPDAAGVSPRPAGAAGTDGGGSATSGSDGASPGGRGAGADQLGLDLAGGDGSTRGGLGGAADALGGQQSGVPGGEAQPGTQPAGADGAAGGQPGRLPVSAAPKRVARENTEAETSFQVQYTPTSQAKFAVGTLVPKNMQAAISTALGDLAVRVGDIDNYVAAKLGYTLDEMLGGEDGQEGYFSAEQVDALALAIDNVERGAGFIIGDQTGVGKGRFVAGMLRYALKNELVPVFVTKQPGLYADMIRDLRDIGMDDAAAKVLVTNTLRGADSIPLSEAPGDVIESFAAPKQKAIMQRIAATGEMPAGLDMVFTTYSQMQYKAGSSGVETERQEAMRALASRAMLVLDESHEAGGSESKRIDADGNIVPTRADWFRTLLGEARGAVYSSATYAKNPQVMSLYFKTDLSQAVENLEDLAEAIATGGVPLQQVVANMLVEAGQYARRERSYEGVAMGIEELATDDKAARAGTTALREVFGLDRDFMEEARLGFIDDLEANGQKGGRDGAIGESSAGGTGFAQVMHVVVSQMLLSLKAASAADKAIAKWRAGEKPIIALSNTNESILTDYVDEAGLKPGDEASLTFNAILQRYLRRLRRITVKNADGEKSHVYMTDAQIAEYGGQDALDEYQRIEAMLGSADLSGLPASPIDFMLDRMRAAGMKVGEITGRQTTIQGGTYQTRAANDAAKKREMNAFNRGGLDALVINKSGSTGYSMHATGKPGNDGKKRFMVVLQPDPNIDVFMQMLGRIHRTGQIELPGYAIGASNLAVEKRLAAVLLRKMASLNANTTASKDSAISLDNVTDFLNRYGDQVVEDYLKDNVEVANLLGLNEATKEGLAAKFTGRLAIMEPQVVAQVYEEIERAYKDLIDALDRMGMNTLEAKTLDLDARTVSSFPLVPAKDDSDGASPFALGADVAVMNVRKMGKPMTSDEVAAAVAEELGGQTRDAYVQVRDDHVNGLLPAYMASIEAAQDRAQAAPAEAKNNKQKERAADQLRRLAEAKSAAGARAALILEKVHEFSPGEPFMLSIKDGEVESTAYAVSLGTSIKAMRSPVAASAVRVTFAIADAGRQVTVPLSKIIDSKAEAYSAIPVPRDWRGAEGALPSAVKAAFDLGQGEAREERQMLTGNILAGYAKFKKGMITLYTDSTGAVRQGVLMPKGFSAAKEMSKLPVAFAEPAHVVQFLAGHPGRRMVKSGDGKLAITTTERGDFRILVSKNGGKIYYLNPEVKRLIGGEGFTARPGAKNFTASVSRGAAEKIVAAFQTSLGTTFETESDKDEARRITGAAPIVEEADGARFSIDEPGADTVTDFDYEIRPEDEDRIAQTWADLSIELEQLGLPQIDLGITSSAWVNAPDGTRRPISGVASTEGVIAIALDGQLDPLRAVSHEALHILRMPEIWAGRQFGLFNRAEWAALEASAIADAERLGEATSRYSGFSRSVQVEEVIANRYMAWRAGEIEATGFLRSAFQKIARFFEALVNALRGNGFQSEASVFRKIASGEIGRRGEGLPTAEEAADQAEATAPLTETRAFREWFGESKMVDGAGQPQTFFHGSSADITAFRAGGSYAANQGFYFSPSPDMASFHAVKGGGEGGAVYPVYLRIENPLVVAPAPMTVTQALMRVFAPEAARKATREREYAVAAKSAYLTKERIAEIKAMGHDGIVNPGIREVVVFDPTQIKSAIGNRGTFSPDNADIRFSLDNLPPEPPANQAERDGYLSKALDSMPIDRAFHGLFNIVADRPVRAITGVGGMNAKGEWEPGRRAYAAAENVVSRAKFSDDGAFHFLNPVLQKARAGLIDRYGLDADYVERDRQRGLDERRILSKVPELLAVLRDAKVGSAEARVLQAILTGEAVDDEAMKALAEPIRQAVDEMGQEAVMLGLISAETFERNRGAYLHRVYAKNEIDEGTLTGWTSRYLSNRRRRIIGDQFKGRGLFEAISVDRLMRHIPAYAKGEIGKPVKGTRFRMLDLIAEPAVGGLDASLTDRKPKVKKRVFLPADAPVPAEFSDYTDRGVWEVRGEKGANDLVLWRDFTKPERAKMGEIVDARYTIAKTYMMMAKDLATGRFFKNIAENEAWATSAPPSAQWKEASDYNRFWADPNVDWVHVPETKISGSNTLTYGAMAGKFVRAEIWRDMQELEAMNRPGFWKTLSTQWKLNKALALDTPIPTPAGWTTMGEIREGDAVFDETGRVCHVVGVREIAHGRPCYRLTFSDGCTLVADEEHWWFTKARNDRTGKVRTTKDVLDTLKANARGDSNHAVPVALPLDMPDAPLPLAPYALGVWLGDGDSTSPRITVGAADEAGMRSALAACGLVCTDGHADRRSTARAFSIRLPGDGRRQNGVKASLGALGVLGDKRIPMAYLRASASQRMALLQGLMDTDGWITTRGSCGFATSSVALRDDVLDLMRSLGFKPTVATRDGRAWRIHLQAYADRPIFQLSRKVARLRPAPVSAQRSGNRMIVGIVPVESVPVRCIEVDSPSHLYLAGEGMIPTHNTARNPVVHMNNVMSNFVLMDMAGVTSSDLVRAVKEMHRGGALYREAKEHGAFGSDMVAQELRENELKPLLKEIAAELQGDETGLAADMRRTPMLRHIAVLGRLFDAIWRRAARFDQIMTSAYQMEDEVFRMATYLRRRRQGLDANHAALEARDQFLNYDIRAPWVNAARRTVLPFISYTYRAVPIIAKTAATRPWKMAKYFTIAYALNALAYQMAPGDDDEETERLSLREAEQGYTWVGVPRMMRMPWLDDFGNPVFLDIRRWVPAGDVFDMGSNTEAIDIPSWLQLGGPLMAGAELALNRSAFTGEDIVNPLTDTAGDRVNKVADYLWKFWLPSAAWVPGSWYWTKLEQAATGGLDALGNPLSVPKAALSSVGIKVRSQDVDNAFYWRAFEYEMVEKELEKQGRAIGRQRERNLISEAEYQRQMESVGKKLDTLAERRERNLR